MDQVVCFRMAADHRVVGVGAMACSTMEIQESGDKSGIGAYTLHHIDDQLYELGEKVLCPIVFDAFAVKADDEEMIEEDDKDAKKKKKKDGKEGKEGKEKKSKKTKHADEPEPDMSAFLSFGAKKEDTSSHWDKKMGKAHKQLVTGGGEKKKGAKKGGKGGGGKKEDAWSGDEEEDETQVNNIPLTKTKGKKKKGKGAKPKKGGDEGSESEEELQDTQGPALVVEDEEGEIETEPSVTPKQMDKQIKEAFLNCLKLSVQDRDLPIESGKIWSHHMILCKPEDQTLDFKLSGYKKLGKFLTTMEKEGYIIYKEANKKFPTAQISKINWMSEKLENWETTVDAPQVKDEWKDTSKKTLEEDWKTDIEVSEVCVPKKGYESFFDDFETKASWTFEEAMKKLDNYLKKFQLINKDSVIINDLLSEKFGFSKEKKPDDEAPAEEMVEEDAPKKKQKTKQGETQNVVKREVLNEKYINALEWCYEIKNKDTGKTQTKKGRFKGITITAEKTHNKQITKIAGLSFFNPNFDKLMHHFQNKFAGSCSVNDLPDKKNPGKELVVQGPWIHPITEFLVNEMKIRESQITTINKLARKVKEGMYG